MATYNTIRSNIVTPDYTSLTCDICGSVDIVETVEGYVCRNCSIILEIQKLQYDRPYNDDIIQYARATGVTQIGNSRERLVSPNSRTLNRLNKHNSAKNNQKTTLDRARIEISRVFTCLDLADYDDVKELVFSTFKKVRAELRPGSKYRNVRKLVSIISYLSLKLRNVMINPIELIEISNIEKKEFNEFVLQVQRFLPGYAKRDRQKYVLHRVLEMVEHFELGMPFYFQSRKIMGRFWESIKNTTDNVIAGLVSSISLLCSHKNQVSVSAICNKLGITMSAIQLQVKTKIFDQFKVRGFVSLVKSRDVLGKIMEKLGLLKQVDDQEQREVALDDEVDIVLGSGIQVFNQFNTVDYYFFAMRDNQNNLMIVTVNLYHPLMNYRDLTIKNGQTNKFLEFDIVKYFKTKDPPKIPT